MHDDAGRKRVAAGCPKLERRIDQAKLNLETGHRFRRGLGSRNLRFPGVTGLRDLEGHPAYR